MSHPHCIKCFRPVVPSEQKITVKDANGSRWYIHPRCFIPADWRTPERKHVEKTVLPTPDIHPEKVRSGPKPRAVKTYIEEVNGERFTVTVLPTVEPDPRRTMKTIHKLAPGDTGYRRAPWDGTKRSKWSKKKKRRSA